MIIIGLIGMPGSGKGECARIAGDLGYAVVNMGDLVRKYTKQLDLEFNDENIGHVAHSERQKYGFGIWAKRTLEWIAELDLKDDELVIIDGIRGGSEVAVFRDSFKDNLQTVAVMMPKQKRFELLRKRKRSDAPMTQEEFDLRDHREIKWGIKDAIEDADYLIINTGTLSELKESFTELLSLIQN